MNIWACINTSSFIYLLTARKRPAPYLRTRVILNATEIYIEQPHLPELQQMTFFNYKNDNTFKALVGISPDGVITFVSSLYHKSLARRNGVLDLLEEGESVMADLGFDIEEDLLLRGVHLNVPPFFTWQISVV